MYKTIYDLAQNNPQGITGFVRRSWSYFSGVSQNWCL